MLTRLLFAIAVACLVSCDRAASPAAPPQAPSPPATATADAERARLNAYVDIHNVFVNGGGPDGVRREYERALLDMRRKTGPGFRARWLTRAIDELGAAAALPSSGLVELERAGDALRTALVQLDRLVEPLPAYFESRAWVDDRGARVLADQAQTLASLDAAEAATARFEQVLEQATTAQTARQLDQLKDSGDVLVYSTALAMNQAKALIAATQAAFDAQDAGAAAKPTARPPKAGRRARPAPDWTAPDQVLAALDQTLARARAEMSRRRDEEKPGLQNLPHREFASVVDSLTSVVGGYRDLRSSTDASGADKMVRAYNNAVGYYARVPMKTYRRAAN